MSAIFDSPVTFPREGRLASIYAHSGQAPIQVPLAQHVTLANGGIRDLRNVDLEALLSRVEQENLDGRGGAHFPSHIKIRAAIKSGPGGIAVANAAEGEPASSKDAAIWFLRPHLALDGLQLVARMMKATEAIVWVHDTAEQEIASINGAIRERRVNGRDEIPVRVVEAPDRYVSGQGHAIVNALQGGPAVPLFRKPGERAWGNGKKPVLVHNTETLARLATIAMGAGAAETLITLVTGDNRIVLEVPNTFTFNELLPGHVEPSAVLIGGYAGVWATWTKVRNLPIDETVMRSNGLSLGAGIIIPIYNECPLQHAADLSAWLAGESARQCGPCLYGTAEVAEDMEALATGRLKERGRARLAEALSMLPKRGGCALPDGAASMVSSVLETFPEEARLHFQGLCSHIDGKLKKSKARPRYLPGAEVSAWTN